MEVNVVRDFNEFESLKDKWNAALQKSPSNSFFLRHEWLSNWWKCYGGGSELLVVLMMEDGEIVSAAPMMILTSGVMKVRKLQFIAHEVSDYMDFITTKDHAENFDCLINEIGSLSALWDFAEFIFIPRSSPLFEYWINIKSERFSCRFEKKDVSVLIDIGQFESHDKYMRSLNKKVRADVIRQTNNINRLGELKLEVYTERDKINSLLDHYFDLHKKKWKMEKHRSQFHEEALMNRYRLLADDLDGSGMLEMSVLYSSGNIVAMHYGFVYGGKYYWYTPTYEPEYQQYSPGKLLLASIIEDAKKRGIKIFDLLRGNEKYKYFWTKDEIDLFGVVFVGKRTSSEIKYLLSRGLKEWFLKTAVGQKLKSLKTKLRTAIK